LQSVFRPRVQGGEASGEVDIRKHFGIAGSVDVWGITPGSREEIYTSKRINWTKETAAAGWLTFK
jgi:hypothetical protein